MTTPFQIPGLGLLGATSPLQSLSESQSHHDGLSQPPHEISPLATAACTSEQKHPDGAHGTIPVAMNADPGSAKEGTRPNLPTANSINQIHHTKISEVDFMVVDEEEPTSKLDMTGPLPHSAAQDSAPLRPAHVDRQEGNAASEVKQEQNLPADDGDSDGSSDGSSDSDSDSSSSDDSDDSDDNDDGPKSAEGNAGPEEWQADCSPYHSESDADSDSDVDDTYINLSPEEMARVLMEQESTPKSFEVRTANEKTEDAVPKPDVEITKDMPIVLLGKVLHVVENTVVIEGDTPGEFQVLDTGSVVCTGERVVIGVVADVIGRVHAPMYTVLFSNSEEVEKSGLTPGTKVFYAKEFAQLVFTQPLRNMKATDASNIFDEEVGEDEVDFSDDEQEREYKRNKRAARDLKRGRGGRGMPRGVHGGQGHGGRGQFGRGGHVDHNGPSHGPEVVSEITLNYDDIDTEPYHPLRRPDRYVETGMSEEHLPGFHGGSRGSRAGFQSRGRDGNQNNFRGGLRNRGRGRGDGGFRGRGNGGFRGRGDGFRRSHRGEEGGHIQKWNGRDGREMEHDFQHRDYNRPENNWDASRQEISSRPRSSHSHQNLNSGPNIGAANTTAGGATAPAFGPFNFHAGSGPPFPFNPAQPPVPQSFAPPRLDQQNASLPWPVPSAVSAPGPGNDLGRLPQLPQAPPGWPQLPALLGRNASSPGLAQFPPAPQSGFPLPVPPPPPPGAGGQPNAADQEALRLVLNALNAARQ